MRVQGKEIDNTAFKMIQTSSLPQMRSSNFQTTTGNNRHKNFSCSLKIYLTNAKGKRKKGRGERKGKEKKKKKLQQIIYSVIYSSKIVCTVKLWG